MHYLGHDHSFKSFAALPPLRKNTQNSIPRLFHLTMRRRHHLYIVPTPCNAESWAISRVNTGSIKESICGPIFPQLLSSQLILFSFSLFPQVQVPVGE